MSTALRWGIKDSFVKYVVGQPDGVITVHGGATRTDDGNFVFMGTPDDPWRFQGTVRFTAHGGFLDIVVANPKIDVIGDTWRLTVEEASGGSGTAIGRFVHEGVSLEDYRAGSASPSLHLTTLGSQILGGVYPAGTELDVPVFVKL
jgi:hypothetical protein